MGNDVTWIISIMEMNTLSSLLTPVRTVVSIVFWRSWLTGTRVLLRNFRESGFQRNMMSAPAFSWGLWEERLGSWKLTKLIGFWALSDVPRALPNDLNIWSSPGLDCIVFSFIFSTATFFGERNICSNSKSNFDALLND